MKGTTKNDGFKVGNDLKQGEGLAPNLSNIVLEYVTTRLTVQGKTAIYYETVKLHIGYADNINIMGRTKRTI